MESIAKPFIFIILSIGLVFLFCSKEVHAEKIRYPVKAGSFYPSDPSELKQFIDQLTHKAQKSRLKIPPGKYLKAIIMPHAGYIYSGWTAAHASLALTPRQFSKVILLGPDHFIGINNGAISDVTAYQTPLGKITLHNDAAKLRQLADWIQPFPVDFDKEHSLEVILPFLQTYLEEFQLVPIVIGRANVHQFSKALDPMRLSSSPPKKASVTPGWIPEPEHDVIRKSSWP